MDMTNRRPQSRRAGTALGIGAAVLITVGLTAALHARFAMGEKPSPRVPLPVATVAYENPADKKDWTDIEDTLLQTITHTQI